MTALLFDPYVAYYADMLDDLERVRIGQENRRRQLTRSVEDSDGEVRGFGLLPTDPAVVALDSMIDTLKAQEKQAVKSLEKSVKTNPLGPWVLSQKGVGLKTAARLLGSIGDPYWHFVEDRPRTVSELWAYCGLHVLEGSAARRRKGVQSNWSTNAKTRAYLIAESCVKTLSRSCWLLDETDKRVVKHVEDCSCSPFRVVYDGRRSRTAETRPEWTDGHSHADGMRVASKEVLKALWIESRRIHEETFATD